MLPVRARDSGLKAWPEDYRALIQGASRGIGLELVRQLLSDPRCGRVFATGRSVQEAAALQALVEEHGERLQLVTMDVREDASIEAAAAELRQQTDELHLLFNVAGILHRDMGQRQQGMRPEKRLAELKRAHLQESFEINAFGPILVAQALMPLLAKGHPAHIVNLSARVGSIEDNRLGGWYAYRASKAAQNQFTRTLAVECARVAKSVCVLALHPGTTDTGLSEPFQKNVPAEKLFSVERAARQLLAVVDASGPEDSGRFFAWDGSPIPW